MNEYRRNFPPKNTSDFAGNPVLINYLIAGFSKF